jgi:hypothetical protein
MNNDAMRQGLTFVLDEYEPLAAFEHGDLLWSSEFQRLILQSEPAQLGRMLPQARFVPSAAGQPATVTFFMFDEGGNEVAGASIPAGNRIPPGAIDELEHRLEAFAKLADNERASSDRRQLIRGFRLPNPQTHPEFYRLYGPSDNRRLLVIWGMERKPQPGVVVTNRSLPGAAVPPILRSGTTAASFIGDFLRNAATNRTVRAGLLAAVILLLAAFALCRLTDLPICKTKEESQPTPTPEPTSVPTPPSPQTPTPTPTPPPGQVQTPPPPRPVAPSPPPTQTPTPIPPPGQVQTPPPPRPVAPTPPPTQTPTPTPPPGQIQTPPPTPPVVPTPPPTQTPTPTPTPTPIALPSRFGLILEHRPIGDDEVELRLRLLPRGSDDGRLTQWSIDGLSGVQTGSRSAFRVKARPEPYILRVKLPNGREVTRELKANRRNEFDIDLNDKRDLE